MTKKDALGHHFLARVLAGGILDHRRGEQVSENHGRAGCMLRTFHSAGESSTSAKRGKGTMEEEKRNGHERRWNRNCTLALVASETRAGRRWRRRARGVGRETREVCWGLFVFRCVSTREQVHNAGHIFSLRIRDFKYKNAWTKHKILEILHKLEWRSELSAGVAPLWHPSQSARPTVRRAQRSPVAHCSLDVRLHPACLSNAPVDVFASLLAAPRRTTVGAAIQISPLRLPPREPKHRTRTP